MIKKSIIILFFFTISPLAFATTGKIIFIKGEVKNLKNAPLKKNQTVKIGDIIITGKKSLAVVQLPQGNKVKVGESSKLKISKLPKNEKTGSTTLSLFNGNAFIKVLKGKLRKGQKSKLTLRTRTTAMGVRGTEFFASYGSGNDVWMCVNEGIVAVKAKSEKKSTMVKAGEGIVVKKGQSTSKPRPLAWTKKLNWNMDPKSGELANKVSIEAAYSDLLDEDYD